MREKLRAFIDPLVALALFAAYVTLLLATVSDLGYARDEGFYFQAARSYESWFELLFQEPETALQRSVVDRYWAANHEHPALMKSLFALSHHFLYAQWGWFAEAGTAYRFPGMLMAGLAVAVLYLWGTRAMSRLAGLVAASSFALMPRVFYHSHLDCFDIPVATMWLVTAYVYWRSLSARGIGWALATGVMYGLLLNTKHNAWLFPAAVVLHWVLIERVKLWRDFRRGRLRVPAALVAIAVIGPVVFYATWPWIWNDTGKRLSEWVAFHVGHEYYNMEFLGRTYWKPPMPRLYAWVMTVATVPLITLMLFAIGLLPRLVRASRGLWARLWQRLGRPAPLIAPLDPSELSTDALWLVSLLVSYAPWLSSNTPIFGGTKHWLTAYPFLCLFAARGFELIRARLGALAGKRLLWARLSPAALAVSVLAGPLVMALDSHPFGLSAYTPIVGGAPGAATLGLNRTFWGYTTGAVTGFVNERAPRSATVYVHDTALQSYDMLRTDGRIRKDLRGSLSIAGSSVALYHHEPHMSRVDHQIWIAYSTVQPAHVGTLHGVPVIWVYMMPRE